MLKIGLALLASVTAFVTPAAAQHRELGKETIIPSAAGGLRNWQAGPAGSNIVFVQDRRMLWYKVAMTGPCMSNHDDAALNYRTDATGNFDRFSQVWSERLPSVVCGVQSITTSAAPKGQPGYKPA